MKISTVIPAYNEAEALEQVVTEYLEHSDEIIIVDDGSSDSTPEIATTLSDEYGVVRTFYHEVNKGKANALRTGVANANGDILVFTDADCTYPAEYIPEMVTAINDNADLVLGSRLAGGTKNIPLLNRIGNRVFSFLVAFIGGIRLTDAQTGLRAMRRDSFDELDAKDATDLEFETRMTVRAAKLGYRIKEIPIHYRERVGESKLNPLTHGWDMFTAVFGILYKESSPVLQTGIIFSLLFILAGSYTGGVSIINKLQTGIVQHDFYPLLTVLFYIIAFQLFTVLLVAEQIKNRLNRVEEKLLDNQG